MPPQEIRIPFPLDMMGDLDTTLRYAEDRHLVGLDTAEKREPFQPLIKAIHAIKAALHAHRTAPSSETHVAMEREHLALLSDFVTDSAGVGADEHRAASAVAGWLDREV